jgi:hypothetical protein
VNELTVNKQDPLDPSIHSRVEDVSDSDTSVGLKTHSGARETQSAKPKYSPPVGEFTSPCARKRTLAYSATLDDAAYLINSRLTVCMAAKRCPKRKHGLKEGVRYKPSPLPGADVVTKSSAECTK